MRTPLFRRTKTKHWLTLVTCLLLSSILLAACGENSPSILDTHGPVADSESQVFWVILIIATIVFVVVEGLLVYSIWRFRERPGMPNPPPVHGNLLLEGLWTAIPMVVLFIVLFFTIRGLFQVAPSAQPAGHTINVRAVGHQWWWEFYYQDYKFTTADTMHVPADTVIHVDLFSNNVIHSFWVPALTGKTDVIPGHDNTRWFKANPDAVGKTFMGICAEYCGTQHGNMRFAVAVDSNDTFNTWVSSQQQAAAVPAAGSLAAKGAQIFSSACTSCHGIVGVNLKGFDDPAVKCNNPQVACLSGPNLTHFGSRNLIAGGVLSWDAASCDPTASTADLIKTCGIAQWLHDPQGEKPGNDMVFDTGKLDPDIPALIAYLQSLK